MQKQDQQEYLLSSCIPRSFARFLQILFYCDIVVLITQVARMTRLDILANLPLFLISGFVLWIMAHWLRLIQLRKPIYVLDEEGILDHSYAAGGMRVSWDEIAEVKWMYWGMFRGLKVGLRDREASLARLSRFDRMTAYINQLCYGSPLVLWQAWSDTPLEHYEAAIQDQSRRQP